MRMDREGASDCRSELRGRRPLILRAHPTLLPSLSIKSWEEEDAFGSHMQSEDVFAFLKDQREINRRVKVRRDFIFPGHVSHSIKSLNFAKYEEAVLHVFLQQHGAEGVTNPRGYLLQHKYPA